MKTAPPAALGTPHKKIKRRILKAVLFPAVLTVLFLVGMTIYHHGMLAKEAKHIKPSGTFVTVDGHDMHVSAEGAKGNRPTVLIMPAWGTAAPVYDYKVVSAKLSDQCHIVVAEKFGYGYSDVSGLPRDVGTVVREYREALKSSGEKGPYVLMPHSMSGLDALYWAQQYPAEVSAIVGLDMAVPESYRYRSGNPFLRFFGSPRFLKALVSMGLARIPGTGLVSGRDLTTAEFTQNQYLTYKMLLNRDVIAESDAVRSNADTVRKGGVPSLPMLMFTSNGDGTGLGDQWVRCEQGFAGKSSRIRLIQLDCGHMVQYFQSGLIAKETKKFLKDLSQK